MWPHFAVLKLSHLVHSTDNFLFRIVKAIRLGLFLWLVDDLDGGDVCVVALIKLELHIIGEEEVHEAALLILRQLAKDEGLRLRLGSVVCLLERAATT